MRLEEQLIELYPEIEEKLKSEQYRLSEIILSKKVIWGTTPGEMAKMMGIDLSLYFKLESADTSIDVEVYEQAVNKLA